MEDKEAIDKALAEVIYRQCQETFEKTANDLLIPLILKSILSIIAPGQGRDQFRKIMTKMHKESLLALHDSTIKNMNTTVSALEESGYEQHIVEEQFERINSALLKIVMKKIDDFEEMVTLKNE